MDYQPYLLKYYDIIFVFSVGKLEYTTALRRLLSYARSRDWLQAGRPRDRNSSPGKIKNILHVVQTGSVHHQTSYPIGTGVSFSGGKAAGPWNWPHTSSYYRGQENMYLYIQSPTKIHGVVLT
jgi:hypothetical protein